MQFFEKIFQSFQSFFQFVLQSLPQNFSQSFEFIECILTLFIIFLLILPTISIFRIILSILKNNHMPNNNTPDLLMCLLHFIGNFSFSCILALIFMQCSVFYIIILMIIFISPISCSIFARCIKNLQ